MNLTALEEFNQSFSFHCGGHDDDGRPASKWLLFGWLAAWLGELNAQHRVAGPKQAPNKAQTCKMTQRTTATTIRL